MTRLDQFESVFNAAAKTVYHHEPIAIQSILVVTDLDAYQTDLFAKGIRGFLSVLEKNDGECAWHKIDGEGWGDLESLLELVEKHKPDLICSYRNLRSDAKKWPYSLGAYMDVLTQVTDIPVLLFPNPESHDPDSKDDVTYPYTKTGVVMAITDHLTGDARLVDYSVAFTSDDGTLFLTHLEDRRAFNHYIDTISKIPAIHTDAARELILKQLLKEPKDYILSCKQVLKEKGINIQLEKIVELGDRLEDYKRLVDEHKVDLLVFNTKDDDQLAMHGMAYPLAVELRELPLLML